MKSDLVYLSHILECIRRIREYTAGGHQEFLSSHIVQDAVVRNLQTMAESTQRLSAILKSQRPGVEWKKISAFRNILTHDYLGVDLDLVWRVVQGDLPKLEAEIESLRQQVESEQTAAAD